MLLLLALLMSAASALSVSPASSLSGWADLALREAQRLLDRVEGRADEGVCVRATREAVEEQLRGALRRPVFVLRHDVSEEELAVFAGDAAFAFPHEVFLARPLVRAPPPLAEGASSDAADTGGEEAPWTRLLRGLSALLADDAPALRQERAQGQSRGAQVLQALASAPSHSPGLFFAGAPNFALLLHVALTMSLATYNVCVSAPSGDGRRVVETSVLDAVDALATRAMGSHRLSPDAQERNLRRAFALAEHAMGGRGVAVAALRSDRACGVSAYSARDGVLCVAFRGTADPVDVLTDSAFLPAPFPHVGPDVAVHGGFLDVFLTLADQVQTQLLAVPAGTKVMFTGHSMGGALAQLAAAHFSAWGPALVTVGAPCIGNAAFQRLLSESALPAGGIRIWNELDAVPYLAQAVGYGHAGVAVKMRLSATTDALVQSSMRDIDAALLRALAPHIVFHVGGALHVFPVMGTNCSFATSLI